MFPTLLCYSPPTDIPCLNSDQWFSGCAPQKHLSHLGLVRNAHFQVPLQTYGLSKVGHSNLCCSKPSRWLSCTRMPTLENYWFKLFLESLRKPFPDQSMYRLPICISNTVSINDSSQTKPSLQLFFSNKIYWNIIISICKYCLWLFWATMAERDRGCVYFKS